MAWILRIPSPDEPAPSSADAAEAADAAAPVALAFFASLEASLSFFFAATFSRTSTESFDTAA